MTREVIAEHATRRFGTNLGYVGEMLPGEAFHCRFRHFVTGLEIEAISSRDRRGWWLVAITGSGGEFARLRGRNWFFDPLSSMEILLPHRQGVRLERRWWLPLSLIGMERARVPPPFDRHLRISRRWSGLSGSWPACSEAEQDEILMVLVAFYYWFDLQRSSD